jgi:spore maturation protein CgeB
MDLPGNVEHIQHVAPSNHAALYSSGMSLNLTREAMVRYGWSPSVRLFEAAACGSCIASDSWPGIDTLLTPGEAILLVDSTGDVLEALSVGEARRVAIGAAARREILASHTYDVRAEQLEAAICRAGQPG